MSALYRTVKIPRRVHHTLPLLKRDELFRRAFQHCELPACEDETWLAHEVALCYLRDYCRPDDMSLAEFYEHVPDLYPWLAAHVRRQAESDYVRHVLAHEGRAGLVPA